MAKFQWRRALFPAGYYGANAVYQGYMSLFYMGLGMNSGQLGGVNAATAAATMVMQPLWGRLGDRVRSRRRLLALLCLLSAGLLPLALVNRSFGWQLLAAALFYGFYCALVPLGDSLLVRDGGAFGGYRLAGGASFALVGAGFGLVSGKLHVVWTAAILLLCTAGAALLLPEAAPRERPRGGMLSLLHNRELRRKLLFLLPVQMTMGFFYTFYAPHFKALGGSEGLLGLGYLLSAACEAPYLLLSGRIYRRFGAEKPMCAAAMVLAIRWLLLGWAKTPAVALVSQALHGGGFIVMTVSMAYWIAGHLPQNRQASGQSLLNLITFGAARILGNLLGGWLAEAMGSGNVFLAGAGVCVGAVILFALKTPRNPT